MSGALYILGSNSKRDGFSLNLITGQRFLIPNDAQSGMFGELPQLYLPP